MTRKQIDKLADKLADEYEMIAISLTNCLIIVGIVLGFLWVAGGK